MLLLGAVTYIFAENPSAPVALWIKDRVPGPQCRDTPQGKLMKLELE